MKSRKEVFRYIMIFWTLFIGLGAVSGSVGMLSALDGSNMGMETMLPYFQVLPFADILFQNYLFPGIALLIVNGITNLFAAVLLFRKKRLGAYLSCIWGVTLMAWITIQFVIFPANVLSTSYFIFGALQFICGYYYIVLVNQDEFCFDPALYTNIGSNKKNAVVYFSRTCYSRKIAYEKADEIGADIIEIKTPERTKGFLGFAWMGRFGMHRWPMPIESLDVDFSLYCKVIIVSPVQVFKMASPVRAFCLTYKNSLPKYEVILVHFRKDSDFPKAFLEFSKLLESAPEKCISIVCKFGKKIQEKVL